MPKYFNWSIKKGTQIKQKEGYITLSKDQVKDIKNRIFYGESNKMISEDLRIDEKKISQIRRKIAWRDL